MARRDSYPRGLEVLAGAVGGIVCCGDVGGVCGVWWGESCRPGGLGVERDLVAEKPTV